MGLAAVRLPRLPHAPAARPAAARGPAAGGDLLQPAGLGPQGRLSDAPAARASSALVTAGSDSRPGAATLSPHRKTPSPRSIAGRSRQLVPGRSSAPERPSSSCRRRNATRSRQSRQLASSSASRRRSPSSADSPGRSGICACTSACPVGRERRGRARCSVSIQPASSRSHTTNGSPRRVRSPRSSATVRPLGQRERLVAEQRARVAQLGRDDRRPRAGSSLTREPRLDPHAALARAAAPARRSARSSRRARSAPSAAGRGTPGGSASHTKPAASSPGIVVEGEHAGRARQQLGGARRRALGRPTRGSRRRRAPRACATGAAARAERRAAACAARLPPTRKRIAAERRPRDRRQQLALAQEAPQRAVRVEHVRAEVRDERRRRCCARARRAARAPPAAARSRRPPRRRCLRRVRRCRPRRR